MSTPPSHYLDNLSHTTHLTTRELHYRMGQGLYVKCLQIAAQELKVDLAAVFTSESASNTVANTSPTAASAGSDLNGYAVHNACVELNKRLEPFRKKLGPDATMAALAAAAYGERISLSATGQHATPNLGYVWNCMEETGNLFDCELSPIFFSFFVLPSFQPWPLLIAHNH